MIQNRQLFTAQAKLCCLLLWGHTLRPYIQTLVLDVLAPFLSCWDLPERLLMTQRPSCRLIWKIHAVHKRKAYSNQHGFLIKIPSLKTHILKSRYWKAYGFWRNRWSTNRGFVHTVHLLLVENRSFPAITGLISTAGSKVPRSKL